MAFFDRNLLSSSSGLQRDDQCMCFPDSSKEVFPVKFPEKAKGFQCDMLKRTTDCLQLNLPPPLRGLHRTFFTLVTPSG